MTCPNCKRMEAELAGARKLAAAYIEIAEKLAGLPALSESREEKPTRTKCWACPQCGYVEGRPFSNCGHVAEDGTCKHPKNLTPECHDGACPMLPAESKTEEPGA